MCIYILCVCVSWSCTHTHKTRIHKHTHTHTHTLTQTHRALCEFVFRTGKVAPAVIAAVVCAGSRWRLTPRWEDQAVCEQVFHELGAELDELGLDAVPIIVDYCNLLILFIISIKTSSSSSSSSSYYRYCYCYIIIIIMLVIIDLVFMLCLLNAGYHSSIWQLSTSCRVMRGAAGSAVRSGARTAMLLLVRILKSQRHSTFTMARDCRTCENVCLGAVLRFARSPPICCASSWPAGACTVGPPAPPPPRSSSLFNTPLCAARGTAGDAREQAEAEHEKSSPSARRP